MFDLYGRQFIELVYEIFGPTIQELGFKFHEENEKLLYARKGDIQLIFRFETAYRVRLFSLEITLLGLLGEHATSKPYYRNLSVTTIAKYSDPEYKFSLEIPSTEKEFREKMEIQKRELLIYCKDILNGNVTRWPRIVELIIKESGWQPD